VALLAGALDGRVAPFAVSGGIVSFVCAGDLEKLPMGMITPNILDVGDASHLAGLLAPRRLLVAGGVEPNGAVASEGRLQRCFAFTRAVYPVLKAHGHLTLAQPAYLLLLLREWMD